MWLQKYIFFKHVAIKKPSQTATAFKNGSNSRKCDFGLWGHLVVKVGGLSDEGVHHAGIDLCGGGVIDKGDCREGWQVVGSAGRGSIGVYVAICLINSRIMSARSISSEGNAHSSSSDI